VNRPTTIAHRGASREAPENTLAAFARAGELGADGVELDVHRTADGAVVVHHDPVPNATPQDPALAGRPFTSLTLAEVRTFRVAEVHPIPTLNEVLELLGDRLTIYCELKGIGVVEAAAPLLARHQGPCAMHAFDHRAVRRAADLAPAVPRGILVVSRLVDTTHALLAARAKTLWPQVEFVDADLVSEIRAFGGSIIAWTANDPVRATELVRLGVDALCGDDVAATKRLIESTLSGDAA
jgi:glycerophosphoryl diester phosphodiesterase